MYPCLISFLISSQFHLILSVSSQTRSGELKHYLEFVVSELREIKIGESLVQLIMSEKACKHFKTEADKKAKQAAADKNRTERENMDKHLIMQNICHALL